MTTTDSYLTASTGRTGGRDTESYRTPISMRSIPSARKRRRSRRSRRGAYTVEFAVSASVFFMVIFACFELTRYLYLQQAIDQAAYEAARMGVTIGATAEEVQERAESLLQAYGVSVANVVVSPDTIDEATTEVTVAISCNYADNSWAVPHFVSASLMETTVTLDHENRAYLIPQDATDDDDLVTNDEPLDT